MATKASIEESIDKNALWSTFAKAVDAEMRPSTTIKGSSGLSHEVEAVAVDDKARRIIVISAESSPRVAAMMQVDIQASIPTSRVIVARPLAIDLAGTIRRFTEPLALVSFDISTAQKWLKSIGNSPNAVQEGLNDQITGAAESAFSGVSSIALPALPIILNLATQAQHLPWSDLGKIFSDTTQSGTLDLNPLFARDNLAEDLSAGVCPIPLYEFTSSYLELLVSGKDIEQVRERLAQMNILQYFFPSPDAVALSLIEEGFQGTIDIASAIGSSAALGHPLGENEITSNPKNIAETIEQFSQLGYVAEGEHGVEITPAGKSIRSTIRYRPREGFMTKLLNRLNVGVSINPHDFIK